MFVYVVFTRDNVEIRSLAQAIPCPDPLNSGCCFSLFDCFDGGQIYEKVKFEDIKTSEKIKEIVNKFHGTTLPELCLNLRMACNGSADPWKSEDVVDTLLYLGYRLLTWSDSSNFISKIDDAVYMLVKATIYEIKSTDWVSFLRSL